MDITQEAILVIKLAVYIAPPALYFVILGLVNSQGRAHVISGRSDWLCLMAVLFPILICPTVWLGQGGRWYLLAGLSVGWVVFLWLSTPGELSSLVVYNTTEARCRRTLQTVLKALGIPFYQQGKVVILPQHDVRITFNSVSVLRNVTIRFAGPLQQHRQMLCQLREQLAGRLWHMQTVPVLGAAGMLIAGTIMLILPLLMMVRHMDALVRLVSDLLSA